MPSSTVEDYLKQIYFLQLAGEEGAFASMGELAAALEVTPGTATSMIKSLDKKGQVEYKPRVGVKLSDSGRKIALCILRRHRLLELFLMKVLGMALHEIHHEAEALEHVVSEKVLERIDTLLGNPKWDPHGDPIPSHTGDISSRYLIPLDLCNAGCKATIRRIDNQKEDFLQFLENASLTPGCELEVHSVDPAGGIVTLQTEDGSQRILGLPIANHIHVETA